VFLSQPDPTPLDVRFRLFGTPIRVHPMFWLFGAFFGYMYLQSKPGELGLRFLALWLAWMFLSILIHEFGHITMARLSGRRGHIILHSFGGLAVWDAPAEKRWQRMAIAAAGPAAGLLLFVFVSLIRDYAFPLIPLRFLTDHPDFREVLTQSLDMVWFMAVLWNLFNLIPIWPLDGGQITLEAFSALSPAHGLRLSLGLSILLAVSAAVYCLVVKKLPYNLHPGFTAFFLGLMALQNLQLLVAAERERRSVAVQDDWA
jgi:stage IV sporulation protein FB